MADRFDRQTDFLVLLRRTQIGHQPGYVQMFRHAADGQLLPSALRQLPDSLT
jgi:hypothetical protein